MTHNEIIARFAGATEFRTEGGVLRGYWPEYDKGPGEGWMMVPDYSDENVFWLWHGPGELLQKIEEKGLREQFLLNWFSVWADRGGNGDNYSWDLLNSTPAQLSAALVGTIGEVDSCSRGG